MPTIGDLQARTKKHSFIIQRPSSEPGFYMQRTDSDGRFQRYSIQSYAVQAKPAGYRY